MPDVRSYGMCNVITAPVILSVLLGRFVVRTVIRIF